MVGYFYDHVRHDKFQNCWQVHFNYITGMDINILNTRGIEGQLC